MKKSIIHLTETTLIYCIGDLYGKGCKPGRLKNRYDKIIDLTWKELSEMLKISDEDRAIASGLVHEFMGEIGWLGEEKHIGAVASFCLDMIEQSEFRYPQGITNALNDISDYIWRNGDMPIEYCKEAAMAGYVWRKLISDIQAGERPLPVLKEIPA